MIIADYFASFRINIDRSSVTQVDKTLDTIEARLKTFGARAEKGFKLRIGSFDVNQASLNLALGTSLDLASKAVPFEISRFVVNDRNMLAALLRAARRLPPPAPPGPNPGPLPPHPGPHPNPYPNPGGSRVAAATGGGLIGRGISGLYGPALALGLGGYGLSELNKRNQQVVSAELQSQAVVQQAGGTVQQGKDSFEWLRRQGNRIGFNYLDASGDYNKLLSGLTGAGMSVSEGQGVFKGFSELSRVNKLDRVQQQRVYRALSQVAGKNKLQSEELTGQLAESLPGAVSIFAEAYQAQLKDQGKGGGKTGQEAITELLAAMKKGQVKGDILTYAGNVASQRAAPGLAAASTASQAEQARYQNAVNDLAVLASQNGVEEGFARIFRTLNSGLSESGDLVKSLAEGFNDVTKWADDLLLFPQSFIRALEGKDSLVADWLGADRTEQLIQDWTSIKTIWGQLTDGPKPEWLPNLESTSKELAAVLEQGAEFAKWLKALKDSDKEGQKDASFIDQPITATGQLLGRIGKGISSGLEASRVRGNAVYDDPSSPYYHDPERYDADMRAGTNRYEDLSRYQDTGVDDAIQFKKDAEAARLADEQANRLVNAVYGQGNWLNPSVPMGISANMGIYDNPMNGPTSFSLDALNPLQQALGTFNSYDNVTPNGQPFQDLSQYNPQTPEEIADYNKTLAMSQADTAASQQTIINNFDINFTVDATLAGDTIEAQSRAAADALSGHVIGALEQVQVNYPVRQ